MMLSKIRNSVIEPLANFLSRKTVVGSSLALLAVSGGVNVEQRLDGAEVEGAQISEVNNHGAELPEPVELSAEDELLSEMINAVSLFCTADSEELGLVFTDGENFAEPEDLEAEAREAIAAFEAVSPGDELIPSDDDICEFVIVPGPEVEEVPADIIADDDVLTNTEIAIERLAE